MTVRSPGTRETGEEACIISFQEILEEMVSVTSACEPGREALPSCFQTGSGMVPEPRRL